MHDFPNGLSMFAVRITQEQSRHRLLPCHNIAKNYNSLFIRQKATDCGQQQLSVTLGTITLIPAFRTRQLQHRRQGYS